MAGITGQKRTVRQIFKEDYAIGDFQRGFTWEREHVTTLVRDLVRAFERRKEPAFSGEYYLGAIVTHNRQGIHQIIDGQQRLTTLLLILIWLTHELADAGGRRDGAIRGLIVHAAGGRDAFAVNSPERDAVMRALLDEPDHVHDVGLETDTQRNLVNQFVAIKEAFVFDLRGEALTSFCDWLLDKVALFRIECDKEADAYIIFETTNNRGQQLGATQLVKNYLQSNIHDLDKRDRALTQWTEGIRHLQSFSNNGGGDVEFIYRWLQSRYAIVPTDPHRDGENDFAGIEHDLFGWLKKNAARMGLLEPDACYRFMHDEFATVARAYAAIHEAEGFPRRGTDSLYFLAEMKPSWLAHARSALLAGVHDNSSPDDNNARIRAIAAFLEIMCARLAWHELAVHGRPRQLVGLDRAIAVSRQGSPREVAERLVGVARDLAYPFSQSDKASHPKSHGSRARTFVHLVLGRMAACLDEAFGVYGAFSQYQISAPSASGYTIEHVLASDGAGNGDGKLYRGAKDYAVRRQLLGALLLLRLPDNTRLDNADYLTKREAYNVLNPLARTFHPDFYTEENRARLAELRLGFKPYDRLGPKEVDERQAAYVRLAELTWNPGRILFAARPDATEDSRVFGLDELLPEDL